MKKPMRLILGLLFAAVLSSGCSNVAPASTISESESISQGVASPLSAITSITIANKEDLAEEWHLGDEERRLSISVSPEINVLEEVLYDGLSIVSGNPSVLSVHGIYLYPMAIGEATITVSYQGISDSCNLTVLSERGEPDYARKTLTEVMAITDLVESGSNKYSKEAFMGKVKVATLGNRSDGTKPADKYGNMWVTDPTSSEDSPEVVQVYGSSASTTSLSYSLADKFYKFSNPQDYLLNEATSGIQVGDVLDVIMIRADYKTAKEISVVIRAINGKVIANRIATTDEILATKLSNNVKKEIVSVTGTITGWKDASTTDGTKYGIFYIQSENAEGDPLYVYGATATLEQAGEDGSVFNTISINDDGSLKFSNPKDFLTNAATKDLAIGDEVTVTGFRCDYQGTIEINGLVTPSSANDA